MSVVDMCQSCNKQGIISPCIGCLHNSRTFEEMLEFDEPSIIDNVLHEQQLAEDKKKPTDE